MRFIQENKILIKQNMMSSKQTAQRIEQTLETEAQKIERALENCASEPIHISGAIQPHGCLLAVGEDNRIAYASANAAEFLPPANRRADAIIGSDITQWLAPELMAELREHRIRQPLQSIKSKIVALRGEEYDVVSHQSGDFLVIECEKRKLETSSAFLLDELRNFSMGLHASKTLEQMFQFVADTIRDVTHFDRVKVYRFDKDWHGEVIAESKADYMPSYLGLHFPASDIPEQARTLYMKHYLRLIADIRYQPIPILPEAGASSSQPLDLSLSMLRSVSPVHIQYLRNINVEASMSISIVQNGKLWGLVACHHNTPHHVSFSVRHVAEIMGHMFSAQLSTLEEFKRIETSEKRSKLMGRLSSLADRNLKVEKLLDDVYQLACDVMEADGLVLKSNQNVRHYGNTPGEETVNALLDWLKDNNAELVETDDACGYFNDVPQLTGLNGGLLAIPISFQSHDYMIWFRDAQAEEVKWAGNPEKPVEQTVAGYRLTPRSSFELWKQTVMKRSAPWLQENIETARSVVNILLESEKNSADRANMAKSEFLANMSHEIRTPMNAIIGLTHILKRSRDLPASLGEIVQTLQVSGDSLLELINDLLDISKIESQVLELEDIEFSLPGLVQEVISVSSVKAVEKGVSFIVKENLDGHSHFIGDPTRIKQIILNLCSNAVKFTDSGSITITLGFTAPDAGQDKADIVFAVEDTGIGIAPEKLGTIFQKFVQADSSISRKYGGTGLGLAISKMLAEAMGGDISLTSTLGKGTIFTVRLPLKLASGQKTAGQVTGTAQKKPVQGKKPLILLVEDYEPNIVVASIILEDFGYELDIAKDGHSAFEKAKSGHYHAILMDVQMPVMNGFETTAMIRAYEKQHRLLPSIIIGMTAHALVGDRERCLAAGMDDYISKPIDQEKLKGRLSVITA